MRTDRAVLFCLALLGGAISQSALWSPDSVPVLTRVTFDTFPESWRGGDIAAEGQSLAEGEVARSKALVAKAVARYPKALISQNLARIYVLRSITFYGLEYGGTNSLDTVYLTNQGVERGYTDRYILASFHHEFSSILLRNYPERFDEDEWVGANPLGFSYGHGGTEALRDGSSDVRYNSWHIQRGFLNQYATASLEEDFNTVAEGMMTGSPEFWAACESSPMLKKKLGLAVKFYRSFWPGFDPRDAAPAEE
ncbi:MAG: hypothetical protein KIT11_01965 [Fimbriimonadaceae bacterium]|nr:hypothetical protein [Fimbriimonadaceae bacterium]QYK54863.1 MAG: hypothetical protein KF733_07570 [Fimbriimonadaceae bacterium]